jgi:hypothetical protein
VVIDENVQNLTNPASPRYLLPFPAKSKRYRVLFRFNMTKTMGSVLLLSFPLGDLLSYTLGNIRFNIFIVLKFNYTYYIITRDCIVWRLPLVETGPVLRMVFNGLNYYLTNCAIKVLFQAPWATTLG